jgi:cytochrome oxidase Cu insertion factor (SCO1/SenC/PrrC family)
MEGTPPNQARGPGFPPGLLALVAVVGIVFALSLSMLAYMALTKKPGPAKPPIEPGTSGARIDVPPTSADPAAPDDFVTGFFIPPFEVVNQDEKPVTNAVFLGKITVIDFFFTHCPFICPAMTGRFSQLVQTFKGEPTVQFLSFSVDPAHDTPAQLREYAQKNEADTARWQFLTGKKEVIWNILTQGLAWGVEERPEQIIKLPTGNEMANIRHPGWFALIGPDAKVLGIYKYDVEEDQQRLIERVRKLSEKLKI